MIPEHVAPSLQFLNSALKCSFVLKAVEFENCKLGATCLNGCGMNPTFPEVCMLSFRCRSCLYIEIRPSWKFGMIWAILVAWAGVGPLVLAYRTQNWAHHAH